MVSSKKSAKNKKKLAEREARQSELDSKPYYLRHVPDINVSYEIYNVEEYFFPFCEKSRQGYRDFYGLPSFDEKTRLKTFEPYKSLQAKSTDFYNKSEEDNSDSDSDQDDEESITESTTESIKPISDIFSRDNTDSSCSSSSRSTSISTSKPLSALSRLKKDKGKRKCKNDGYDNEKFSSKYVVTVKKSPQAPPPIVSPPFVVKSSSASILDSSTSDEEPEVSVVDLSPTENANSILLSAKSDSRQAMKEKITAKESVLNGCANNKENSFVDDHGSSKLVESGNEAHVNFDEDEIYIKGIKSLNLLESLKESKV